MSSGAVESRGMREGLGLFREGVGADVGEGRCQRLRPHWRLGARAPGSSQLARAGCILVWRSGVLDR